MPRVQTDYGTIWKNDAISGVFRGGHIKLNMSEARIFMLKPVSGGKAHQYASHWDAKKNGWYKVGRYDFNSITTKTDEGDAATSVAADGNTDSNPGYPDPNI